VEIQLTYQAIPDILCDALVVGAARSPGNEGGSRVRLSPEATVVDAVLGGNIDKCCQAGEFTANLGEILTIHSQGKMAAKRVIIVGLGLYKMVQTRSFYRASAIAARYLRATGACRIALALYWHNQGVNTAEAIQTQIEGVLQGLYTFRMHPHTHGTQEITHLLLVAEENTATANQIALYRGQILAEATNFARDLVNETTVELTPWKLSQGVATMASQWEVECEIFDQAKIAGHRSGETFWSTSLEEIYEERIKSKIANFKQEGSKTMIAAMAAKVLQCIANKTYCAYLDITGICYKGETADQEMGATGVGVRTLAELALRLSLSCKSQEEGETKSTIARILKQIDLEFEETQRGMKTLVEGSARHTFLQKQIAKVEMYEKQLAAYVGADTANRLVCEHYIQSIK
jgi:leucyl aminopeptidase